MIRSNARIFVATAPVSFRGAFDALAGAVRANLDADPRSGAFFVFFNRSGDKIKVLFFDQTGDCILYKRLDQLTFNGTIELDTGSAHVEIDARTLERVLRGVVKKRKSRVH